MQSDSKEQGTLQSKILNTVRKEKTPCTIFLTNGFQIKNAVITGFDSFVLLVKTKDGQMMIYKHAVSSLTAEQLVEELPEKVGE
ncbi:MAG: RNA chaperone Hfq [Eubacteriales bacterium]|nr:RNA chaperone Hfq [Eubacteriales bacterium]